VALARDSAHLDDDGADGKDSKARRPRLPGAARVRGVTKNDAHAALVERQGEVAAGKISRCKVSYLPMVMTSMLVGPLTGLVAAFVAKAGGYGLIWDLILGVVGSSAGNEIVLVVDVFRMQARLQSPSGRSGSGPRHRRPEEDLAGARLSTGALFGAAAEILRRENPGVVAPELRLVGETWRSRGGELRMERCARCHRELRDATQRFCSECNRGVGTKPGRGTRPSPGRTSAKRRRRRGG
jgi:uncharacterized membrane protein YeaQ/YmgE (transglycosylase-associated protein family)